MALGGGHALASASNLASASCRRSASTCARRTPRRTQHPPSPQPSLCAGEWRPAQGGGYGGEGGLHRDRALGYTGGLTGWRHTGGSTGWGRAGGVTGAGRTSLACAALFSSAALAAAAAAACACAWAGGVGVSLVRGDKGEGGGAARAARAGRAAAPHAPWAHTRRPCGPSLSGHDMVWSTSNGRSRRVTGGHGAVTRQVTARSQQVGHGRSKQVTRQVTPSHGASRQVDKLTGHGMARRVTGTPEEHPGKARDWGGGVCLG